MPRGSLGRRLTDISEAVDHGESLSDALTPTGDYFPTIFREMIEVGEETGHIDSVFAQLADHYDAQLRMRRIFYSAITWPMIQLGLARWSDSLYGLWGPRRQGS